MCYLPGDREAQDKVDPAKCILTGSVFWPPSPGLTSQVHGLFSVTTVPESGLHLCRSRNLISTVHLEFTNTEGLTHTEQTDKRIIYQLDCQFLKYNGYIPVTITGICLFVQGDLITYEKEACKAWNKNKGCDILEKLAWKGEASWKNDISPEMLALLSSIWFY